MMRLRIGIDIGGTFTDLVAIAVDGEVHRLKLPSTPSDYALGVIAGVAELLGQTKGVAEEILHATTIGSNAILERKTARTALVTTKGFRDVLEIRDLRMPRLYDIDWTKPEPLVPRDLRLEVTEKLRPDGSVATALNAASLAQAVQALRREGVESVAICLLHSYANPAHEQKVADAIRHFLPEIPVSVSHEILPEAGEYPRTSTTVVNAAIQPVVQDYLGRLQQGLDALSVTAPMKLMQSNGGLTAATHAARFPARIVESGPAAGVVGAAALARRLDENLVVTFDMGGTTAKAGMVEDGAVSRSEQMEVGGGVIAGARLLVGGGTLLKLPTIDLAEIGAGGGSICRLDPAWAPVVGPESAGADPGPVCYGRGGKLPTITDCNLVLGYLDPAGLAGGSMALDRDAAEAAIAAHLAEPLHLPVAEAAMGMRRIAVSTMMRAIRAVSVERGRDVRAATLMAFGGNGPLFAAAMAADLGISRILVPPMPGLFSAFGLLLADTEHHITRAWRRRVTPELARELQTALYTLQRDAHTLVAEDGYPPWRRSVRVQAMLRYVGQSSEIPVPLTQPEAPDLLADLPRLFSQEHARVYGFAAAESEPIEIISLGAVATGKPMVPRLPETMPPEKAVPMQPRQAWFEGTGFVETPVLPRGELSTMPTPGPLIVQEYDATCLVPPGWTASRDAFGNIAITRM
jgi:N-methylhydantoinase A